MVVGSGSSGVQAAQTLVGRGARTLMLDIGEEKDPYYSGLVPNMDFSTLRCQDNAQHTYFLGKDFSGVIDTWTGAKNRITPPLKFVERNTDKYFPKTSPPREVNFMESAALGGLANAWGCGAFTFSEKALRRTGLSVADIRAAYPEIACRIGVSGEPNSEGLAFNECIQPPLKIDRNMAIIRERYKKVAPRLNKQKCFLERTPLAVQHLPHPRRQSEDYKDLDFWDLEHSAAYRPPLTLQLLKRQPGFTFLSRQQVLRFEEKPDEVCVHTYDLREKRYRTFRARRLILAASVIGTARIVAGSFPDAVSAFPIISTPYFYMAMLNLGMMCRQNSLWKSSYSQLSLYIDSDFEKDFILLNMYTYRSLLLSRLVRELNIGMKFGYETVRFVKDMLVVGGVHLPEKHHPGNQLEFLPNPTHPSGLKLKIDYQIDPTRYREAARRVRKAMLALHCVPVKKKILEPGSGKHYAGTLPFSDREKAFSLAPNGRLYGTRAVYVADASGFRYLSAKGPTFTIMAYAHTVADGLFRERATVLTNDRSLNADFGAESAKEPVSVMAEKPSKR